MNIAKRRVASGMTQKSMAERLGVSRSTIAMWESGASNPRVEMLSSVANLLHCSIDDLIERDNAISCDSAQYANNV